MKELVPMNDYGIFASAKYEAMVDSRFVAEFFEKEHNFHFGMQPSTLAKKTLGVSYAEAEEFAYSIYRQYILELPESNEKAITEQAIQKWQAQVVFSIEPQKGETAGCQKDL